MENFLLKNLFKRGTLYLIVALLLGAACGCGSSNIEPVSQGSSSLSLSTQTAVPGQILQITNPGLGPSGVLGQFDASADVQTEVFFFNDQGFGVLVPVRPTGSTIEVAVPPYLKEDSSLSSSLGAGTVSVAVLQSTSGADNFFDVAGELLIQNPVATNRPLGEVTLQLLDEGLAASREGVAGAILLDLWSLEGEAEPIVAHYEDIRTLLQELRDQLALVAQSGQSVDLILDGVNLGPFSSADLEALDRIIWSNLDQGSGQLGSQRYLQIGTSLLAVRLYELPGGASPESLAAVGLAFFNRGAILTVNRSLAHFVAEQHAEVDVLSEQLEDLSRFLRLLFSRFPNVMAKDINQDVWDSVTQANTKVIGDPPALSEDNLFQYTAQALANAAENATEAQNQSNITARDATRLDVSSLIPNTPAQSTEETLLIGQDLQLEVIASSYFDQQENVTRIVDYESSAPSVARVDINGVVTGVSPGQAQINITLRLPSNSEPFLQISLGVSVLDSPP